MARVSSIAFRARSSVTPRTTASQRNRRGGKAIIRGYAEDRKPCWLEALKNFLNFLVARNVIVLFFEHDVTVHRNGEGIRRWPDSLL